MLHEERISNPQELIRKRAADGVAGLAVDEGREQRVGEGEDILEHDQRKYGGRNDQQAFAVSQALSYRLKVSGYAAQAVGLSISCDDAQHRNDEADAGAFERGAGEAENDDGRQQAHLPPQRAAQDLQSRQ